MKKFLGLFILAVFVFMPIVSSASTASDLQALIISLTKQLQQLQTQLSGLNTTQNSTAQIIPSSSTVVTTTNSSSSFPRIFFNQAQNNFVNQTVKFTNSNDVVNNSMTQPYFLYSYVETPQLISKPSDNVSNPFSLPMGHYVLSDGSAGVIINSTSPNAGSNNFTATGAAYNSYLSPIVPAYNFVPGITMWQNDQTSSLQYKIDLRVPYLAVTSVSGYPSGGYGYGYFLFKDKTTQKTFWLGMEFFNNWAPDATAERVGCDCGNGGTNMPNVQSNLNSPHTYASPTSDSAAFASSAFTDWRTFGFTVSPSQFSAAISAIQQQYPNSNFTNDLRNYQLIQVSLDTETSRPHYDPNISSSLQGQAVIGAQFRNLTVSEIAGQGQVLPIVPSVTPIVPTTPITITAPTTSTTQTTPVTSTTQVTPSVPAVACSLSVNHASVYSNNSDTWTYTGTSNPSGYAIKRYGTKNGVMDLNGDSAWGPTNFNLTYGPVGPGTEGTYVRWFTISDPNTGALLCTSNQATMTILPTVPVSPTVSLSASPTSIAYNGSTVLTWTTTNNPTSCTATGGTFVGAKATGASNNQTVSNIITNTTYTIQCSNAGGSSTASSVSVSVGGAPVAGACGASSGSSFYTAPTTNLCSAGTPTLTPSGSGPWSWGCNGLNGGTNTGVATCSANKTVSVPSTPTGFLAGTSTCGTGQINLSWNTSTGSTSYQVYRDGTLIYNGSALAFSDAPLTPGSSHTYTITATGPGGTSVAGGTSPGQTAAPTVCSYQSSCVSISAPTTVVVGHSFAASVTMKNTGGDTWQGVAVNPTNPYRLGSQDPQDNGTWNISRVDLPTNTVAPGSQATFNFNPTAPSTPGTYNFDWAMLQEGVAWFVPLTKCTQQISVLPAVPTVSGMSISPASIVKGNSYQATFSGQNLTTSTYFDVLYSYVSPDSTASNQNGEVDNWQQGLVQSHTPTLAQAGVWTITGVRAHTDPTVHSGSFTPVNVTVTVTNPPASTVSCSFSVSPTSIYANNSDKWTYTGTSNPSGYAIKRYGTKNGVMDLNGDSVWGPTNFNLTYGPVGPGTEGTYVRWFTISDPNTGALLCTSNQATMTILPAVAPTQTSSVSSTNQMASALESMMQVLQSMKNSLK